MKGFKTFIYCGLIAITLASCGNSGKQAKSGEEAKKEATPETPTKTYREIAVEFVSEAIAIKKISMNIFFDYGVNWELFENGEKVYDEKNELTRCHIIDMVLAQRQQFYMSNNTFKTMQGLADDMTKKLESLTDLKNDTQITRADLVLIGTTSSDFINYFINQAHRPSETRTNFLLTGGKLYKDFENAINLTGDIAQEATPTGDSIYSESITSTVKQYWENFLYPYLNKGR